VASPSTGLGAGVAFDSRGRIRRLSHASHPQLRVIPRDRKINRLLAFLARVAEVGLVAQDFA
jgi:hypothetical protein